MGADENKKILRRLYDEVYNAKKRDVLEQLCAKDVVDRNPLPGQGPGLAGVLYAFDTLVRAFPDMKMSVEQILAEGDTVMGRITCRGTHKGEFLGIAPTNKTVEITGMDMITIKNGKIADWSHNEDIATLLAQIGAVQLPTGNGKQAGAMQGAGATQQRTRV